MQGKEEIQNPTQRGGLMDRVAGKLAATDKRQESWEISESESWSIHEKEVTGKLVASRTSGNSENSKAGSRKWPQIFLTSPAVVPPLDKVYSIVRKIYGRSPTEDLNGPRREHRCMVYIHERHTSSSSSSWSRLYGEFSIYQESTP